MTSYFHRLYGELSLRGKLLSIIVGTSACALLVGYALVLTTNISVLKSELKETSRHLAEVVADFSIAPLSFSDVEGVHEVLGHLDTIPSVEAAVIFDRNDQVFGRYLRDSEIKLSSSPERSGEIVDGRLITTAKVQLQGRYYGQVVLYTSTHDLQSRIVGFVLMVSGIFLILLLAALYFANKLEHYISDRIIKLTNTTRDVSTKSSFDVRLEDGENNDEISELYSGFNSMFEELKRRESERDKVELLLRVSEARFRAIVQDQTELICRCGVEGEITFVNEAFTRFFNRSFDSLLGSSLFELIPAEYRSDFKQLFEGAEVDTPVQVGEIPVKKSDGSWGWLFWTIRAIFDVDNTQLVAFQGVGSDFTELRTAQEEKLEIERQLQHSQRLETIGTLAGGIAHDFNNILTPLGGYVDLLMMEIPSDGDSYKRLEQISQALVRARELVRRILTFSRQSERRRSNIQLQDLVRNILTFLRASIPRTIKIDLQVGDFSTVVSGDEAQLHQAIMNLCTNAYQSMKDRGSGQIDLALYQKSVDTEDLPAGYNLVPGEYLCLEVRDDGYGISDAVRGRIFEPFFTTKVVGEGTGLGLSVVHGIIVDHGGAVTVESAPEEGATFTILLPCFEGEVAADRETQAKLHMGKGRVLFVDDEEMIVEMGVEMLEMLGYSVESFTSPVDVLEFYREQGGEFDVILTDQTMPGLSGIDLIRKLRRLGCNAPALISTGYSTDIMRDELLLTLKIVGVLHKPYQLSELSEVIRAALDEFPAGVDQHTSAAES